jgi:citrate lyase subunit beta/citryl-CoA lyase
MTMRYGPVWLFAPANAARKAEGALASTADVVVLDLEDAVPPAEKPAARAALAGLAAMPRRGVLFVRVNATGTPQALRDIQAAVAAGVDGIMLPKAETDRDAGVADWSLQQCEAEYGRPHPLALVPLVETARGVSDLGRIAWPARVPCVAFGTVDYEADLGLSGPAGQAAVTHGRHAVVLGSRAAGLGPPIDGVTLAARDAALCREEAEWARSIGFGGKLAIHPAQIEPIQAAFRPTPEELDLAAEVVRCAAQSAAEGSGAVLVRGRLVDAPVVMQAKRLLDRAAQG